MSVSHLTAGEWRTLNQTPTNKCGVLVTLLVAGANLNTLSIIETVLLPILAGNGISFYFAILFSLSVSAILTFYTKRHVLAQRGEENLSDRSFVFISMVTGILGSLVLVKENLSGGRAYLGLSLLMISMVLGLQSTVSMGHKIIGSDTP